MGDVDALVAGAVAPTPHGRGNVELQTTAQSELLFWYNTADCERKTRMFTGKIVDARGLFEVQD